VKIINIDVNRPVAFAAAMLFAVVAPSCGGSRAPKVFCSADTCPGCCDDTGACVDGKTAANCGSSGVTCQQCTADQNCTGNGDTGFQCRVGGVANTGGGSANGGGAGGGGGGTSSNGGGGNLEGGCSAANCAGGCCNAQGTCVAYAQQNYSKCGTAGAACGNCQVGKACQMGVCTAPTCTACMDTAGNCRTDKNTLTDDQFCGSNDGLCAVCDTLNGEHCMNGHCVGATATCNASNCDGCCSGNTCIGLADAGISDAQCGIGGAACSTCTNATCNTTTGACDPQNGTGGGSGAGGGVGTGSCDHTECTTGDALLTTCDSCTAALCAIDSFCCTDLWDSTCVSEVSSACGMSCNGGTGGGAGGGSGSGGGVGGGGAGGGAVDPTICQDPSLQCVDADSLGDYACIDPNTASNFPANAQTCASDADCPFNYSCWASGALNKCLQNCASSASGGGGGGSCAHDKCTTGSNLASGCDSCVTQVCSSDSFCCTDLWDSTCVSEVGLICGTTCP
jgi:hypothetical protein